MLPEPLSHRFGFLLTEAARRLREETEEALGPFRIIAREGAILELLLSEGGHTQSDLCAILKIDKNVMVKLVDHLEELKLLKRVEHPTDRRSHALHLTAKGSSVIRSGIAVADRCQDKFLGDLSAVEREIFRKILLKLFKLKNT